MAKTIKCMLCGSTDRVGLWLEVCDTCVYKLVDDGLMPRLGPIGRLAIRRTLRRRERGECDTEC